VLIHEDFCQPGSRTAQDEIHNITVTRHDFILTFLTFVFISLGALSADLPVLLVYAVVFGGKALDTVGSVLVSPDVAITGNVITSTGRSEVVPI
jgi:hypothetical protein